VKERQRRVKRGKAHLCVSVEKRGVWLKERGCSVSCKFQVLEEERNNKKRGRGKKGYKRKWGGVGGGSQT